MRAAGLGLLVSRLTGQAEARRLKRALDEKTREALILQKLVVAILEEDRNFHLLPPADLRLHVGSVDSAANWWKQGRGSAARVLEIFGSVPEGPVLDWGCGSGRTFHWLHAHPVWREAWRGCDVDERRSAGCAARA